MLNTIFALRGSSECSVQWNAHISFVQSAKRHCRTALLTPESYKNPSRKGCKLTKSRKYCGENERKKRGKVMRLDKYLKVSRLIKRRTVANEACDAGRVMVNGKPAKASANVKQGDTITIQFGNKEVKVEVLDVQETVKKEEAKDLFRYI
jgi:ribosomal 50S subunit-recycling heat shock protein